MTNFPDMSAKDIQEIEKMVQMMKKGENLGTFHEAFVNDEHPLHYIATNIKIGSGKVNYTDYKINISKGKDIVQMSDAELTSYYKKIVPFISKDELNYLIEQAHRLKRGETRYLLTEHEQNILQSISLKQHIGLPLIGINNVRKLSTSDLYPKAEIPLKQVDLDHWTDNQLGNWIDKGKSSFISGIFDDVATTLENDVYLYRGIGIRDDASFKMQLNYLNNIKEGAILDNTNKFISTAKSIEYSSLYRSGLKYSSGTSYVLKIKVPKGTKAVDMRIKESGMDEMVLKPHKLKITHIDQLTGVVDCEYIPVE